MIPIKMVKFFRWGPGPSGIETQMIWMEELTDPCGPCGGPGPEAGGAVMAAPGRCEATREAPGDGPDRSRYDQGGSFGV